MAKQKLRNLKVQLVEIKNKILEGLKHGNKVTKKISELEGQLLRLSS